VTLASWFDWATRERLRCFMLSHYYQCRARAFYGCLVDTRIVRGWLASLRVEITVRNPG
jgi:hypothetical protein